MSTPNSTAKQIRSLDIVLKGLMRRYKERVPDVPAILTQMKEAKIIENDDDIENDHIAFRTMGVPLLGIQSLERIFVHLGYQKQDFYDFPSKKLNAYWYSPPADRFPRIFISELRVPDLSEASKRILTSYTDEVTSDPIDALDMDDPLAIDNFLHTPLWRLPTWEDYSSLQKESEYAAWVLYNRYYLNHYTISVHNLSEGYNTVPLFNKFLEEKVGVQLNQAGGAIKTSEDGLLIQSSTVAKLIEAPFRVEDNKETPTHSIAGSYVEFAERRPLPGAPSGLKVPRSYRRDGFEASNADKIFESTYSEQTQQRV